METVGRRAVVVILILLVLAWVGSSALLAESSFDRVYDREQWEYEVVRIPPSAHVGKQKLQELGKEGWDLTGAYGSGHWVLKRPLMPPSEQPGATRRPWDRQP